MNEEERLRRMAESLAQFEEGAFLEQIRGQMIYHLDRDLVLSRESVKGPMHIHVFTIRPEVIAINSPLRIVNQGALEGWQQAWNEYIICAESRNALKKLTGRLPNHFYQLSLLASGIRRAQHDADGPFILLTMNNIRGAAALESALRNLPIKDQHRLLSSSFLRDKSLFVP